MNNSAGRIPALFRQSAQSTKDSASLTVAGSSPASFACAIACAFPNGDTLTAEGKVEGTIAFAPMGEGGFGYDPIFFVPEKRKTFSQLTAEEKNEISHRGVALRDFAAKLENYMKEN